MVFVAVRIAVMLCPGMRLMAVEERDARNLENLEVHCVNSMDSGTSHL